MKEYFNNDQEELEFYRDMKLSLNKLKRYKK